MEEPTEVSCPWCGEMFTTFLDLSMGTCEYIEDCQVCCRPILLNLQVQASNEDGLHWNVSTKRS